ncbi:DNA glycosylase AlkZ-like family protein [Pigmentiphaga litoralis]|uniref:DNA glycosylase AlkZ-like family protein n=1 Tax=Pigmentiphaga litoralis TaxID=516702 RepID=UPI003B429FCC
MPAPFTVRGESGADAVRRAVEHLGYVQIDTIQVIERCHHHILWSRIPEYCRADLHHAQSVAKTVFEYWTHALAYVPSRDMPFFLAEMKRHRLSPRDGYRSAPADDVRRIVRRVRDDGALSLRDIDDDVEQEKDHPWGSRKPSRRALQAAFFDGALTISERTGMVKRYELTARHFGWAHAPKTATPAQCTAYVLDRALRAQGLVSVDSVCHLDAPRKPAVRALIDTRVRRGELLPVLLENDRAATHWVRPEDLEPLPPIDPGTTHILSPFDPLIIQRKRLDRLFGYLHRFEAYVPKARRVFGYFTLPVLAGDQVVAAIDIKADRPRQRLQIQQWTWVGEGCAARHQPQIDEALHRFEAFQFRG